MVEGQRLRKPSPGENGGFPGIVPPPGDALGLGDESRRDGVLARIAAGRRVGVELPDEVDAKRRFLVGFPDGRIFAGLAVVDESPGQGPAVGRISPPDEDDPGPAPRGL